MQDILNLKRNLNPIIGSKVTAIFRLFVKLHPNGSANGGATPSRNRSDFSLRVTVRVKRFDSPGHLVEMHREVSAHAACAAGLFSKRVDV